MSDENIHTNLTVDDVKLTLQIIEVVAKRGAFLPEEFIPIGVLVKKLTAIVDSVKDAPVEEAPTEEQLVLPFTVE
jgi:hypothetical protein